MTLLPGAVTTSAQSPPASTDSTLAPVASPKRSQSIPAPAVASPPLHGSSPLPTHYHALPPFLLAPTLTPLSHSLAGAWEWLSAHCREEGRRKGKQEEKRELSGKQHALLPLVPIPGAQLWLGLQAFRQALTSCFWGCLWKGTQEEV